MRYFSADDVALILSDLGYQDIKIRSDRVEARCSCSVKNDRSFRVMLSGRTPGYLCHRCRDHGSLEDRVWQGWATNQPVDRALKVVSAWLLNREPRPEFSTLDYAPWATKPVSLSSEQMVHKVSSGVQFDLTGVARDDSPVPALTEDSLSRFLPGPDPYLTARGFTNETQAAYDIMRDPNRHRVVFPIRGWEGEILSYSRRLTWSGDLCFECGASIRKPNGDMVYKCKCGQPYAKYLHAKGFSLKDYLYGQWLVEEMTPYTIPVLVEGMTDAMRLWQGGVKPPLALPLAMMGANLAQTQLAPVVQRLDRSTPIFMVMDNDNPDDYADKTSPGKVAAFRARMTTKLVSPTRPFVVACPGQWKDPGDASDAEIERLISILGDKHDGDSDVYLE